MTSTTGALVGFVIAIVIAIFTGMFNKKCENSSSENCTEGVQWIQLTILIIICSFLGYIQDNLSSWDKLKSLFTGGNMKEI